MEKPIKTVQWLASHRLVLLATAGAAGTLARYAVSGFVQRVCGSAFPWGTLVVNVMGCLLFGFFWSLAEERLLISPLTRLVVLTGFMGAFTTFSTFAFETGQMLADVQWQRALANVAVENISGIAAVFAGFAIARIV